MLQAKIVDILQQNFEGGNFSRKEQQGEGFRVLGCFCEPFSLSMPLTKPVVSQTPSMRSKLIKKILESMN